MSHPSTSDPLGGGPWRVLILDASPDDPMWLIATVSLPNDVRPAHMDGRRYRDWEQVTDWVTAQVGPHVSLTPISAVAWRIDEGEPRD
jgi:hypothetical protein